MKVLFVRSGNKGNDPITYNQGLSLLALGLEVEFVDIIGKGIYGYLKNIKKVRININEFKPDIIHAHYSLSGFVVSLTFPNRPVVVSLMGSDVNSIGIINLFFLKFFATFFWDRIIVKSEQMKKKIGFKGSYIIPNGVNFDKFKLIDKNKARDYLKWEEGKKHIIFASDPNRFEKNFNLALSAIKLIENLNIEIHFLKGIKFEEMNYYYNAADLLLLTSLYEGSPNVVKEAMACNCPIVSTDVGDVKQIIGNTKGCFVVDFEINNVANAIEKAINFGSRTDGRSAIINLKSEVIAEKIVKVYESTI